MTTPAMVASKFSVASFAKNNMKTIAQKFDEKDIFQDLRSILSKMHKDPALCNINVSPLVMKSYISHMLDEEDDVYKRGLYYSNNITPMEDYQRALCYYVDTYYTDINFTPETLIPSADTEYIHVYRYDDNQEVMYADGEFTLMKNGVSHLIMEKVNTCAPYTNLIIHSDNILSEHFLKSLYTYAILHRVWVHHVYKDTIPSVLYEKVQDSMRKVPQGALHVYTDASVSSYYRSNAVAVAITLDGRYVHTVVPKRKKKISSVLSELYALHIAVQNYTSEVDTVIIHSDCLPAVRMVKRYRKSPHSSGFDSAYVPILRKIYKELQRCDDQGVTVYFTHVLSHGKSKNATDRRANDIADRVAKVIRHSGINDGSMLQIDNIFKEYGADAQHNDMLNVL